MGHRQRLPLACNDTLADSVMSIPLYQRITPAQRFLITFVVMASTLMEVIDTTIVNVALPHMQGTLSASPDEITWTLTSYMVASAIIMPLTGYLADRLGRKYFLILAISAFTVSSALCGAANSLSEIVVFRLMQGIFGGALVPLSQAILADVYAPEDRSKAMAIWGVGVMVGPILGPTLGGYLTEIASWRWTFYVNVPVGILTLMLINVVPDTRRIDRKMDWLGLGLLSFAIGALQFTLDRGNSSDWFASSTIQLSTYLTIASFVAFILHQLSGPKHKVIDIKIFSDRNFALSSLLMAIVGLGLYGTMVVLPMMMETLLGYPVFTTGLLLAPRGLSGMVSMAIVSQIANKVDPRWIMLTGIITCATGIWAGTYYSLNVNTFWLVWPMILQGFGMGFIFVPLSTIAFSTLPPTLRTEAAGLFSLLRTIGGSIGISIAITLYTRRSQVFWNELGGAINVYNQAVYDYLRPLHMLPTQEPGTSLLSSELMRQASMLAFDNVFAFITFMFICMIPMVFVLRKGSAPSN